MGDGGEEEDGDEGDEDVQDSQVNGESGIVRLSRFACEIVNEYMSPSTNGSLTLSLVGVCPGL